MALPASDTFTRADGALGANWTGVATGTGNLGIVSFDAVRTDGPYGISFWNADVFSNDHYSEIIVTADNYPAPAVRLSAGGGGNGYMAILNSISSKVAFFKLVAGEFILINDLEYEIPATGPVARLTVSGTTLTLSVNGTDVQSVTDAAVASGSAGMVIESDGAIGAWSGDNLAPSGTLNTLFGVALASVKTVNPTAIASVKSVDGLTTGN